MFNQPERHSTNVRMFKNNIPRIIFKHKVLVEQDIICKLCDKEVAWVGLVNANKTTNTYVIEEIFLPHQGAHGTNCEITAQGYFPIEDELMRRNEHLRLFTDLKFWGHSHVNMGTGPSGTDQESTSKRVQEAGDYFIRCICNKRGEMHLSFFDNVLGLGFEDIAWEVDDGIDHQSLRKHYTDVIAQNVRPWDEVFPPDVKPVPGQTLVLPPPTHYKNQAVSRKSKKIPSMDFDHLLGTMESHHDDAMDAVALSEFLNTNHINAEGLMRRSEVSIG